MRRVFGGEVGLVEFEVEADWDESLDSSEDRGGGGGRFLGIDSGSGSVPTLAPGLGVGSSDGGGLAGRRRGSRSETPGGVWAATSSRCAERAAPLCTLAGRGGGVGR